MNHLDPGSSRLPARRRRRPGQRGFTLLDVGLGVLSLALAAALAITSSARRQQAARCVQLSEEITAFAKNFAQVTSDRQTRPPSSLGDNSIPAGMESVLRDTRWTAETPVGGHYRWNEIYPEPKDKEKSIPANSVVGSIMVTAFSPDTPLALTPDDLHRIDVIIDDGNLATGDFRAGFNGWPMLYVRVK